MRYKNYQELLVWQKSMDLVVEVYRLIALLPDEEKFGLSAQMRRAAVSIPSNISEGYGRCSDKDFNRFLNIAYGSLTELETQLFIAIRLEYFEQADLQNAFDLCKEVGKLINALIARIKSDDAFDNKN